MLDDITILNYLNENIDEKRIAHSQRTANEAVKLAKIYGADEQKARIAGLLHDVAKGKCKYGLKKHAEIFDIDIDEIEAQNAELIHGKLGAAMVQKQLGLNDEEILSAIRWHTTGRAGMTLLEKIIYLADITEPSRDFEGIETIRSLACLNIDRAMREALSQVIGFVKSKGFTLHPKSVEAYHYFKEEIEKLDASIQ